MKVIITTSNLYHHCLPVFFKCWEKHWGGPLELVGYKEPENLPTYVTFVSLGEQRGPKFFSNDLAKYFKEQPQWFIWMMEDTFIKGLDRYELTHMAELCRADVGRIGLTTDIMKREHFVYGVGDNAISFADPSAKYRLSTQPSIWNRDFLLQYLTPGLTPWDFETQETRDGWKVYGPVKNAVIHNEGVRRSDIHKLNLDGIEI